MLQECVYGQSGGWEDYTLGVARNTEHGIYDVTFLT